MGAAVSEPSRRLLDSATYNLGVMAGMDHPIAPGMVDDEGLTQTGWHVRTARPRPGTQSERLNRTVRLLCCVALLCVAPAVPAWCQDPSASRSARQTQSSGAGVTPVQETSATVSVDRIRRALAEQGPLETDTNVGRSVSTFRVNIVGTRFVLPGFQESFHVDWQPVQPGWLYHQELLNMVTRPEARPYAAFTGPELAQVAATSLGTHVLMAAASKVVQAIRQAARDRQKARIKRQIAEELAAIERANRDGPAAVRPTPPPPRGCAAARAG